MAVGDAEKALALLLTAIDPVTGKLGVKADLQVGNLDVGLVDQGLPTAGAPWKTADAAVVAQLNITLSALRDAIVKTGGTSNTLADIVAALAEVEVKNDTGAGLSVRPSQGTFTDRSGTITTGGTRQQVMAANSARRYLFVQNVSSGRLWVRFGGNANADQPSTLLEPSDSIEYEAGFVNTDSVDIIGATTGQSFTAKEA